MKKNKIFLLLIAFAAAIFLFTSGHYEVDDKGNKTWVADYHGDNPPEEDSSSNGNSSDEHNDDDGDDENGNDDNNDNNNSGTSSSTSSDSGSSSSSNSSSSSSSTPSTPPPPPPEPQYPDPTENMEDEDLQIIAENGTAVQKAEAQRILEQHRFNAENLRLEEACFDYSEIVEQIEEEQKENPPAPEPEEVPAQEEINQEVALIQEIQEQQEIEKQKTIQQNNEEIKEEEIAENSDDAGDPVLVTQGVYEQNEKDIGFIQTGGFYVYRKYLSDKNVISSFGSGWSTNLDERIILGTDSRSEEYIEKLAQGGEHIQQLIRQYEAELAAAYGVSDIYSAQSEYTERITSANASKASQQQLKGQSQSLLEEAAGYPAADNISLLIEKIDGIIGELETKIQGYNNAISQISNHLENLNEYKEKYNECREKLSEYEEPYNLSVSRKKRNEYAMFQGLSTAYEETGLNTLTLIDENGYPHVFKQNDNLKQIWYSDTKKYICIQSVNDGEKLCLIQADGITKEFDSHGFIVKITDRNQNQILIHRTSDEKITFIENSFGEKLKVEYKNNYISKITNMRDSMENIVYSYRGNFLEAVKDTDGDTVFMKYDSNGCMTELKKNDGSKIVFEYGEITNDKKKLTTSTIDEEGNSESFYYDRSGMRTVYTDHDNNQTIYEFDNRHRTRRVEKPDGSVILYDYDKDDNLIYMNENGFTTYYDYDTAGRKNRASYEDDSYELWTYDSFGAVTSYRDRDGVVYDYIRDDKGNLKEYLIDGKLVLSQTVNSKGLVTQQSIYDQNVITTAFEYDSFGNVKSETCGGVKKEYCYDERNRLKKNLVNGKESTSYEYFEKEIIKKDYNGLTTTYLLSGRKDLIEILQKDIISGAVHKIRLEYDKRHLPLRMYAGDGKTEKLVLSCIYTAEGKISAQILHGDECWITMYEYEKGEVSLLKQFKTSSIEGDLQKLLQAAGDNVYTQKYERKLFGKNELQLTVTDGLGISKLFEYDSFRNLVKAIDGNGNEQRLDSSADSRGRVADIQSKDQKIWYEYDDFDRIIKEVVGNSLDEATAVYYVTYDYSSNGRSVTVTEGGKYKSIYELDAFGNIIRQTDGNGNSKRYEYNCLNQLVTAFDGYQTKTTYEYNAIGELCRVVEPEGAVILYTYNYMGLLEKVTDECGILYSAVYDKAGRLKSEFNRAQSEQSYEYDNGGRILKVLCGGEIIQSYSYSKDNRTVIIKDGNGNDYFYNYDAFDTLLNERNRNGLVQQYFYNENGQYSGQAFFDGSTVEIIYSDDKKNCTVRYSDGSENHFVYDEIGNIVEAQNANDKTVYQYDKGGRLVYQKDITSGEELYFEYDNAGNRIRLLSSNRDTRYAYGKNNEVKEIFDNKQKVGVELQYNKNGSEVLRKFANGTKEETLYDRAGRVTVKMQKSVSGELLWAEAYLYGDDGKRSATVDNLGQITLYEYDKKGQLSTVYYPFSQELVQSLSAEAEINGLAVTDSTVDIGVNKFLSSSLKEQLSLLMEAMQRGLSFKLTNMQLFIKESYGYDKNGNRISKALPFGTIQYTYDKENRLTWSGSRGNAFVSYTYDDSGNLLTEKSSQRVVKYAYNAQNRLIYCEVTDNAAKTYAGTSYAYDAFGRRVVVQDIGEAALRTLYDGFSFDVIKQSPAFYSLNATGKPTGERYRYLGQEDNDGNRYFYLDDNSYKLVNNRYRSERSQFVVNGTPVVQTTAEGSQYFSIDLMGSVRSDTDSYGYQLGENNYDAFGSLVQASLSDTTDLGYLGKPYDPISTLYNYGFRDYSPSAARFTTSDPLRDGPNWFTYCRNDPINFVDLWGLFYYRKNGQKTSDSYKRTEVYIYRPTDGLGNEFNSTRMIFKNGVCVYADQVGANCSEQYYDGVNNFTEPDGVYYYSFENLIQNDDGTYDSGSYHNVIRHKTDDPNIPEQIRNAINNTPGDFLEHGNQFSNGNDSYNLNQTPGGAGCTIGKDGQVHQNEFMSILLEGVDRPEEIKRVVYSYIHEECK